ncbi:MAG TPA: hypothetical protein VFI31_27365 [Pirellulales bacterium]|nr:hypothetical protein [Pirellulales bacterium]
MTTSYLAHAISAAVQGFGWAPSGVHAGANESAKKDGERSEWQRIEALLSKWSQKQPLRDEDGVEWPSPALVEVALNLARSLEGQALHPPSRVVPNGEGGVVFEFQREHQLQTMEVDADGSIELCRFEDSQLVDRSRIRATTD